MLSQHSYLIHSPAAWEEVAVIMAVQGNVQHAGVLVERLLCAVAMVNILHNTADGWLGWSTSRRTSRSVTILSPGTLGWRGQETTVSRLI